MAQPPWTGRALSGADYSAAELSADDTELYVLDQRLLPSEERYETHTDVAGAAHCIRDMVVRGAPAIGITAAYGMVLAAREGGELDADDYRAHMHRSADLLEATRPTAVNLSWALNRCKALVAAHATLDGATRVTELAELSRAIHRDDVDACRTMGELGAGELLSSTHVLTHCNAGALATGGYGTALGVVRAAAAAGKLAGVYATETRPYLQGARLTAWELCKDDIDVTVVTDGMVAHCMSDGRIGAVVVGADRIAANGDVANKIGTYGLACLAKVHDIPFYVAAPWSTVDLDTASGADIVIEQRARRELTTIAGRKLVPDAARVYNPAFDVTPAALIRAIITERGVLSPGALGSALDEA
jgi:methylthioribose-1-phosphate isomerase